MLTVSCFCVVWNYLRLRQLPNVNPPQLHSVWFIAHDDPADINLSRTFYKLAPTHGTRHCGLGVRCDGAPSFAASALTAAPVASAASPPIGTSAHVVVSRFRPSTSNWFDCLCITRTATANVACPSYRMYMHSQLPGRPDDAVRTASFRSNPPAPADWKSWFSADEPAHPHSRSVLRWLPAGNTRLHTCMKP